MNLKHEKAQGRLTRTVDKIGMILEMMAEALSTLNPDSLELLCNACEQEAGKHVDVLSAVESAAKMRKICSYIRDFQATFDNSSLNAAKPPANVTTFKPVRCLEMSPEDKGHIETICRRHDIKLLSDTEALMSRIAAGDDSLLTTDGSWIAFNAQQLRPDGSLANGIYVGHSEAKTSEHLYLAALHEIGHCMCKHEQDQFDLTEREVTDLTVQQEIEAWEWAFAHAWEFPSDDGVCYALDCLATYSDHLAENQQQKNGTVYDINEEGEAIASETRIFEDADQALRYAKDRIPVGEAFAVCRSHRQEWRRWVETFGSKVALRNGGWI